MPSAQILRFLVTGAASAFIYSIVFLGLTYFILPREWAEGAVLPAFAVAVCFGYQANAAWTFRRSAEEKSSGRFTRYVLSQSGGAALNFFFTWLMVSACHLEPWTALVPSVTITPIVTYLVAKSWVFA